MTAGCDRQDEDEQEDAHFALAHELRGGAERARQPRDDARHDDHGNAVADSLVGDLLAQPHQEQGAGMSRLMTVITTNPTPGL